MKISQITPKRRDNLALTVFVMVLVSLFFYLVYAGWLLTDAFASRHMDFMPFYAVTAATRQQGYSKIFDLDFQYKAQQQVPGFVPPDDEYLLANHPPFLYPLLAALNDQNYEATYLRWMLLLTAVSLVSLWILAGLLPSLPGPWPLLLAGCLFYRPVFIGILGGQDSAFLLLGVSVFLWGMLTRREILAGLGLSLLTLRPQMALFFILPVFFWSRKAFWAYLSGCALLALSSVLLVGTQGTMDFIHIMQVTSSGEWFVRTQDYMVNLLALALRLFPALNPAPARAAAWWVFGLAAAGTALLFALSKMDFEKKFGIAVLIAVFNSPHLNYHDLSLLVIPTVILLRELAREKPENLKTAALVIAGINLLMLFTFMFISVYVIPYFLIAGLSLGMVIKTGKSRPLSI